MTKKRLYHTKLQHSWVFVSWFTKTYNVDLKSLQKQATNAYDPACNMVLKKMSKPLMWAIYFNVVSNVEAKEAKLGKQAYG